MTYRRTPTNYYALRKNGIGTTRHYTCDGAKWAIVGQFYDDDDPFYGVDDDVAFAMDEEWDFSDWGDPEPD